MGATKDVDIVADKSMYGKHWKTPDKGDKEAAALIPDVYLLKTVLKKKSSATTDKPTVPVCFFYTKIHKTQH